MASTAGVTYTYDGDGQRVKKAASSPSSYDRLYWYGPGGQVLAESELDGDIISEFIYFGGTRIARRAKPTFTASGSAMTRINPPTTQRRGCIRSRRGGGQAELLLRALNQ